MNYFNNFEIRVDNLRNKIKLNDDKLFYDTEKGFYNIIKEGRVEKKMKNNTVTIYFSSSYEKELFKKYFKVNSAIVENISGDEVKKIMQFIYLIENKKIKINNNDIEIGNEKIDTGLFLDNLKKEKENENFF